MKNRQRNEAWFRLVGEASAVPAATQTQAPSPHLFSLAFGIGPSLVIDSTRFSSALH